VGVNLAPLGPDVAGTDVMATYTLIGDASGATIIDNGGNQIGTGGAPVDPLLGPLEDNGGPTLTHALLPGSPAIDAGDPSAMPGVGDTPQYDQRGLPVTRVYGVRIDIGAYESQAPACDFDADDDCDTDDIDMLIPEITSEANNPAFDLTGDDLVNLEDRDEWLAQAGALNLVSGNPFLVGDSNLDGIVDGLDFTAWNVNKFTFTNSWTGADWNADGFVDGLDFNEWNANKFIFVGLAPPAPPDGVFRARASQTTGSVESEHGLVHGMLHSAVIPVAVEGLPVNTLDRSLHKAIAPLAPSQLVGDTWHAKVDELMAQLGEYGWD
jgi:hypothetical protein